MKRYQLLLVLSLSIIVTAITILRATSTIVQNFDDATIPTTTTTTIITDNNNDNLESKNVLKSTTAITTTTTTTTTNESNNNSNMTNNNKPYLIVHIGPPKTGTTTIQYELNKLYNSKILEKDNYYYLNHHDPGTRIEQVNKRKPIIKDDGINIDKIYTLLHASCQKELSLIREDHYYNVTTTMETMANNKDSNNSSSSSSDNNNNILLSLKETLVNDVPCWKEKLDILQYFHKNNINIIVSSEVISIKNMKSFQLIPRKQKNMKNKNMRNKKMNITKLVREQMINDSMLDWPSIILTISEHWNIVIVIGYRYYFDWLPSAKQQVERYTPRKPRLKKWPGVGTGAGKGIMIQSSIFPKFIFPKNKNSTQLRPERKLPYRFTDEVLYLISRDLKLSYQYISLLSKLSSYYTTNNNNHNNHNNGNRKKLIINKPKIRIFNLHDDDNDDLLLLSNSTNNNNTNHNNNNTNIITTINTNATTTTTIPSASLFTKFICNIIPNAKKSCMYHIEKDLNPNNIETNHNPSRTLYYDILACTAAKRKLFNNTKIGRATMNQRIKDYHQSLLLSLKESEEEEQQQNNNASNSTTTSTRDYEFPLKCPNENDLNTLLQLSLYKHDLTFSSISSSQKQSMKKSNTTSSSSRNSTSTTITTNFNNNTTTEKHNTTTTTNTNSENNKNQNDNIQHIIDAFMKSVDTKKYCWIDTNTTLQRKEWIEFFQNISLS